MTEKEHDKPITSAPKKEVLSKKDAETPLEKVLAIEEEKTTVELKIPKVKYVLIGGGMACFYAMKVIYRCNCY